MKTLELLLLLVARAMDSFEPGSLPISPVFGPPLRAVAQVVSINYCYPPEVAEWPSNCTASSPLEDPNVRIRVIASSTIRNSRGKRPQTDHFQSTVCVGADGAASKTENPVRL